MPYVSGQVNTKSENRPEADLKRFFLFAGSGYYPVGGWEDFRGDFDTIDDARSVAKEKFGGSFEWWHIVDMDLGGIAEAKS